MTPGRQVQKLLAEVLSYDEETVLNLLPLAAALQGALNTRLLALQQQAGRPETDYLLNTEEVAARLGKTTKWVRENLELLPFALRLGKDHRFSARGLEQWIAERRAEN